MVSACPDPASSAREAGCREGCDPLRTRVGWSGVSDCILVHILRLLRTNAVKILMIKRHDYSRKIAVWVLLPFNHDHRLVGDKNKICVALRCRSCTRDEAAHGRDWADARVNSHV